jgi:cysteine synthase A
MDDSMQTLATSYLSSIGNTPLVELSRVAEGCKARLLAKVEGRNASGSIKARVAYSMVSHAKSNHLLKPGMGIVEPTCGNLGIALAMVAAAQGISLTLVMPHTAPTARIRTLERYGVNLEFTYGGGGMQGAILRAKQLTANEPDRWLFLNQFENRANELAHLQTTGPEIWEQAGGDIDVLVCGVGTGGTLMGLSRFLKQRKLICTVAVEPSRSPVLSQTWKGLALKPGSHAIEGLGAGFVPPLLDFKWIDRIEKVDDEEAYLMMSRLAREEGLCVGPSCGAAMAVAVRMGMISEFAGKTIVVVLPESYEHRIGR